MKSTLWTGLIAITAIAAIPSPSQAQITSKPRPKLVKPAIDAEQILSVEEFELRLAKTKNEVLYDLRKDTDYKSSHLSGAQSLPYNEASFATDIAGWTIDKTTPLFVYGANKMEQKKLTKVILLLEEAGYSEVFFLDGGIEAWAKKGKPVEAEATEINGF